MLLTYISFLQCLPLSESYPLELQGIETHKGQVANLIVNAPPPYELAMCYTDNISDPESWKPMIEYSSKYKYVEVDLPPEGDYDLFYTFRLTTSDYSSFCQPFRYSKKGYVVIDKNYKKEMSKKFKKKEKVKADSVSADNETVLIHWFGLIFVVFILLCLVAIFSSGGSGGL